MHDGWWQYKSLALFLESGTEGKNQLAFGILCLSVWLQNQTEYQEEDMAWRKTAESPSFPHQCHSGLSSIYVLQVDPEK